MATIDHDAKTVSTVCQLDDEAGVRVALQEILDDNPGYKPILIVEDANGKETTYTSLSVAPIAEEEPAEVVEEAGDPDTDGEDTVNDEDEEDEEDEDEDEGEEDEGTD